MGTDLDFEFGYYKDLPKKIENLFLKLVAQLMRRRI
ncbi:MAG: hypothetical protein CM1200mP10_02380 [Candidatus Neomarinimicrobiota bacterium]|nr:MAG: hypothetical protein CM1200mP10_02380 [Candidatus Neomarinimicrobiota bacterium]